MTDWRPELVQVGWRSRKMGQVCDCPVYERSPHADSGPVYVEAPAAVVPEERG